MAGIPWEAGAGIHAGAECNGSVEVSLFLLLKLEKGGNIEACMTREWGTTRSLFKRKHLSYENF